MCRAQAIKDVQPRFVWSIQCQNMEIGRQIGVSFAQQQVGLKFVATDGDAKAFHGLQDAMPTVAAERQADTTHLGQTQF